MFSFWNTKIAVDLLGQEFLDAVNTWDPVSIHADGTVEVG
jgi:hypothetical protein